MRLDGIDFLRGLAVISVIIYHFFAILGLNDSHYFHFIHSFGIFGVSLFFVISGYLIYRSAEYSFENYGIIKGVKHYTFHRLFRIVPAYYFNLIIVVLLSSTIINLNYFYSLGFIKQIVAHMTFLSYFIYQDAGLGVNGAYWTLSIEMLWYIIAPLFLLFVKKDRTLILISLLSLGYLWGLDIGLFDSMLHMQKESPTYMSILYYYSFQLQGQLSYFIAGILIYKYIRNKISLETSLRYPLALIVYALFIYGSSHYDLHSSFLLNNLFMLLIVSALFILLYDTKPMMMKPMEWIGKISYSLYLWHMPLLFILKQTSVLEHLSLPATAVVFVITLLTISSMSYYLIEEGGFRLRKKFEARLNVDRTT